MLASSRPGGSVRVPSRAVRGRCFISNDESGSSTDKQQTRACQLKAFARRRALRCTSHTWPSDPSTLWPVVRFMQAKGLVQLFSPWQTIAGAPVHTNCRRTTVLDHLVASWHHKRTRHRRLQVVDSRREVLPIDVQMPLILVDSAGVGSPIRRREMRRE